MAGFKSRFKRRKPSKLKLSQQAHGRLYRKYAKIRDSGGASGVSYDVAFQRSEYHYAAIVEQQKKQRVLTPGEKEKVFNRVISTFY